MANTRTSRFALIVVGTVLIAAVGLRLYMVAFPLEEQEYTSLDELDIWQDSLAPQLLDPFDSDVQQAVDVEDTTTDHSDITAVELSAESTPVIALQQQVELGSGLAPSVAVQAEQLWLGYVLGNNYVVQEYSSVLVPIGEPRVLVEDMSWNIIGSAPQLQAMPQGFALTYRDNSVLDQPTQRLDLFDLDWAIQVTHAITIMPETTVKLITQNIGPDEADSAETAIVMQTGEELVIRRFLANGQVLSDEQLTSEGELVAARYNSSDIVIFTQHEEQLVITKHGVNPISIQAATAAGQRPISDIIVTNDYLFTVVTDGSTAALLETWSENIATSYPIHSVLGNHTYGSLAATSDTVVLASNQTTTTLTEQGSTATEYVIVINVFSVSADQ